MCLNLAELRGGVAFNVVPPGAELVWSLRPPPGMALETVRAEMAALVPPGLSWRAVLENPAFATRELDRFAPLLGEAVRAPVDLGFWTEAAMLSAAGIDAVVFGPGDIGLAHAADEFVPLGDLEAARAAFLRMFAGT